MSKPHKWAKEIKAWADGAKIEARYLNAIGWTAWKLELGGFIWYESNAEYRIKPQPKEPQYLYVIRNPQNSSLMLSEYHDSGKWYVGKIKLEQDDE